MNSSNNICKIIELPHGLPIIKDFISERDENNLIDSLIPQKWNTKLKK